MGTLFTETSNDLKGCKHCGPFRNLDLYHLWMDSDTLAVLLESTVRWCWSMFKENNMTGFEEREETEISDNVMNNDTDKDTTMEMDLD